jgi:diacylglycerol kinase (ATP)
VTNQPGQPIRRKRALLLVNPKARSGAEAYLEAASLLESRGFSVLRAQNAKPQDFCRLIHVYSNNVDLIVLGGGDGTIRCALEALVKTKTPFAILPLGTANNFARNLGIPLDLKSALEIIDQGVTKQIDVALVNGEYFANVSGLGLSTVINHQIPSQLKRRFGAFAYIWYALKIIRRFKPFHARITANGITKVVRTMQITICNGKHYGPGMIVNEDASIDDGKLDLLSTEIAKWWHGLKLIPSFFRGIYNKRHEVRLMQAEEIEIWTRRPLRIDTDGEILTRTPAKYRVMRNALTVYAPVEIKKAETVSDLRKQELKNQSPLLSDRSL